MRMPNEAITQLRDHQTQLDMDGVMVGVSRQAIDEVLAYLSAIEAAAPGFLSAVPADVQEVVRVGGDARELIYLLRRVEDDRYRRLALDAAMMIEYQASANARLTDDLARVREELDEAKSKEALYAKVLLKLRNTLLLVQDGIEDEGDRVYFGSSNDADQLREVARKIDGLRWDKIMESSQPPVDLYALLAEQRSIVAASQARIKVLEEALREAIAAIDLTECPHPARGRPDDDLAPACFDSDSCGCCYGTALKAARLALGSSDEVGK